MNDRIKLLALQATTTIDVKCEGLMGRSYVRQEEFFDKEKFAELIVRECADAADMYEGKSDYVGDCVAEYMGYGQEEGVAEWRAK